MPSPQSNHYHYYPHKKSKGAYDPTISKKRLRKKNNGSTFYFKKTTFDQSLYQLPSRELLRKKLKKCLYSVFFVVIIGKEARKLSRQRRKLLQKFGVTKFDEKMEKIKNWLF